MLTPQEFARLEQHRVNYNRTSDPARKKPTQLALEHIEALSQQHAKALKMIETMVALRRKSWCYRVPAFFALLGARVVYYVGKLVPR